MACVAANLAFIFPGGQEMFVILVVGIMLFGRRLPEVGRAVAKTVVQLRQGLNKLKEDMDLDEEVADLKDSIRDVKDTISGTIDAPRRAIKDPGRALMDLTDESLSMPNLSEIKDDVKNSLFGTDSHSESAGAADSAEEVSGSVAEQTGESDEQSVVEKVPDQS